MKTYEITKEKLNGAKPLCYGYKAVKWDGGTQQTFRYGEVGENIVGKVFRVDGNIRECNWGLHFSKDPANVFNFYEPLGYNRYFKVAAYEAAQDASDGAKTVAQCIEFIEEYDLMQYVDIIKRFDRTAVNYSTAVRDSNAVSYSTAVNYSTAVSGSTAVNYSTAVSGSNAVRDSTAVSYSTAVSDSYGTRNCKGLYMSAFCVDKNGGAYCLFNKKSTKERVEEVIAKVRSFNWTPQFANWYDIKGNKEWWAFCFPQLANVDNDIAWSKIPADMLEYIKSLPEFNEKVWNKLTGK